MPELLEGAVALDAMGGDHAPAATVQGAVEAVALHGVRVLLVGRESVLRRELAQRGGPVRGIEIVDAPDVVAMDDAPTAPVRAKRQSSLAVAAKLVRDGQAVAFVSAGNTGAAMVTAKLTLGAIEGIERPALAALLPGIDQQTLIVDAGANVDCKPQHLVQFGIMGHFYSHDVMGVARPRVGLLSIGEEEGKGNDLTREAYGLLAGTGINFIGNVEGRDVYAGTVDVVVCDGFVGNVVLKVSEGLGEMVFGLLKREARKSAFSAAGFLLAKGAFTGFKRRVDYAEVGGAPLLGVRGACLVGHGRSNPKAIRNALRVAHAYGSHTVVRDIEAKVAELRAARRSGGD
ncbi:MAG TPA: phosphate acyltransferase PlsX [Thermoanaerobaculaceae bacterium]|nr:phosphate acyltransferase PlsX [Thermoanaerobaculaceae bacterium]HRS17511.1 phosphate acyltransferase PlsX [Thermoanaerobaculaceae bacterium]